VFTKSKTDKFKDGAEDGAGLALELARDKKFRKELLSAVGHGHAAKRQASKRVGTTAMLKRLATDEHLRGELSEMADNLRAAKERAEKKRSGGRGRRMLLFVGAAGAVVAIPQLRNAVGGAIGGVTGMIGGGPRVITDSIEVSLPATTVYNQWTQFEDFPKFMEGVEEVRQLDDTRLRWVATVGGKRNEWTAKILEQHPDTQVSWVSEDGKTTRGTVTFEELGGNRTRVTLSLSYMAQGLTEHVGSIVGLDRKRVRGDLERFKTMIEARGEETGAWRGEVHAGSAQ